ncbi:hypothetical protein J437_LFUL006441 [Ladona fulva]|uniref:Uncharacterized protein n=1 Tax=Ladona fulva TaxID=123851 RepID=A0A8K0JYF0_LADFU|nr:hypothetical protein J437_LFUL006441 [Ladona fulva]
MRKLRAAPSPTPPASAPSTLRGVRCQSANSIPDEDPFCRLLDYTEDEVVYYTRNHRNHFSPALTMHKSFETIQYLDLDHPETTGLQQQVPKSPDRSQASGIVYKTVDFVKTEAFQRTKQEVEKVRKCT